MHGLHIRIVHRLFCLKLSVTSNIFHFRSFQTQQYQLHIYLQIVENLRNVVIRRCLEQSELLLRRFDIDHIVVSSFLKLKYICLKVYFHTLRKATALGSVCVCASLLFLCSNANCDMSITLFD